VSKTTFAEPPYLNRLPWSVSVTPAGTWTVDDGVADEAGLELDGVLGGVDSVPDAVGELEDEGVAPPDEPSSEPELHPATASAAAVPITSRETTRVGRGRTSQQPSRRSAK
jgi:hypothetical protein